MENCVEMSSDSDDNVEEHCEQSKSEKSDVDLPWQNFFSLKSTSESSLNSSEPRKDRELSAIEKRLNIISQLKTLREEQTELTWRNSLLHRKICDYYVKSKRTEGFEKSFIASNIHSDERYETVLNEYTVAITRLTEVRSHYTNEFQQLTDKYDILVQNFDTLYVELTSRQLEVSTSCENKSKNPHQKLVALLRRQKSLLADLITVRIAFLKSQNYFTDLQRRLNDLNNFGDGQTLTDYENLLMERDALAEKLDQREKEIKKIRHKCVSLEQALTRVKKDAITVENQIKVHRTIGEPGKIQTIREN